MQVEFRQTDLVPGYRLEPARIKKYRAVFAQSRGVAWPKAGTFDEQQSIQDDRRAVGSKKLADI
jgi:hypothetical protein